MKLIYWLRALFKDFPRQPLQEQRMSEELESFLQLAVDDKCRSGMSPAEARREALMELGGLEPTKEKIRDVRAGVGFERLWQDIRYAFRLLLGKPGFSLAVLLTLALGVGANSAIYSLGEAVLFRSAPVERPQDLVAVWTTCRLGTPQCSSSYPDYLDYRQRSSTLQDLAAYTWRTASLGSESGARVVTVQLNTGNYFSLLGVGAHLGRPLLDSDDLDGQASHVVVLSHRFWSSHFSGSPDIVGKKIALNRRPVEVVGVAPAGFDGLHLGRGPDIHLPLRAMPVLVSDSESQRARFTTRGSRWIPQLVGRLAPGATLTAVRQEMAALSDQLAQEDPDARGPRKITVESAGQFILPVSRSSDVVAFVSLLAGVVGLTLLLACANLSNLLLARGMSRQHEMGIRVAIGASRSRLIRQQITETLVLAVLGGFLGLLVARLLLQVMGSFELPGGVLIQSVNPELNTKVMLMTFGVALVAGLGAAFLPALHGTRFRLAKILVQGGGRVDSTPSAHHFRRALVGVQLALSLVLLVGTGVFLNALRTGLATDLGFRTSGLVSAQINLSLLRYSEAEARRLLDELLTRIEAFPGVEAAGVGTRTPLGGGGSATFLRRIDGYTPSPDEELRVNFDFFRPGFVRALGLDPIAGETLETTSSSNGLLINRHMSERWWAGRNPVGGQIDFGGSTYQIVGVLEDARWWADLEGPNRPFILFPLEVSASRMVNGPLYVFARTMNDSNSLMTFLQEEIRRLDRNLSPNSITTMDSQLGQILMPQRMAAFLFTCFSTLGLLLAAVGIYGITSFSVERRSREIGLRLAVGARRWQILWLMARQLAAPLFIGVGFGVLLIRFLGGAAEGFLLGRGATDVGMILLSLLALIIVAGVACLLPASKAARSDPLQALRTD